MQDSESRQIDRSQRVHEFTAARSASFPAGSRIAELIAEHDAVSLEAEQLAAKQAAAVLDWQEQTEQKNAAIKSLREEMKLISQTARSINKQFPGIADQFKMPRSSDQSVLNHGRGYIESATPIAAQFTSRGLPATFPADMQAIIERVEAAEARQTQAFAHKTNMTASLVAALKRESDIVREMRAIVRNIFRQDPGTLAEWEGASRVEKAPKKATKKKTATPSTTPKP